VWAIAVPAPALVGKARALLRVSALTGDHHLSQRRTIVATKLKDVGTVQDALDERDKLPPLNIAQRIAAVMGEVDYVQKEKKQGMNYSIVSHDAVTAKVRPLLHKHGVIYYPRGLTVGQNGNRTEAVFTVRFENIDDRTDYIDVETFGYGVDPQDKGPGKAMSYGVKYALLKVLGLETGDDPDTVHDERADFRPDAVPGTIAQAQFEELESLRAKAGVSAERFCKRFEIDAMALLPVAKFAEAKAALTNKIKEPANA
jgi:hypothetical protein